MACFRLKTASVTYFAMSTSRVNETVRDSSDPKIRQMAGFPTLDYPRVGAVPVEAYVNLPGCHQSPLFWHTAQIKLLLWFTVILPFRRWNTKTAVVGDER